MRASEFYAFIVQLCEASGAVARRYFLQDDIGLEIKANQTPVTLADREAEALLREMIGKRYPSHGIIGEELGSENEDAEFVWTLDPIDGTLSFVAGIPLFGTLISLLKEGEPILGAIHQPILNQLCIGDGTVTELNESTVRMRNCNSLPEAVILTTDVVNVERYQDKSTFDALLSKAALFRTWGDCYGYLLLASARADVMLDPIMNPWDLLPLIPIIRGAGGSITTWDGGDPIKGSSCIATAGGLHDEIIQVLRPK